MARATIEITINDDRWPKLTLIGTTTDSRGERTAVQQSYPYDQFYSQAENTMHNLLRPLVEKLTQQKKRGT